jgi:hypothetical protein
VTSLKNYCKCCQQQPKFRECNCKYFTFTQVKSSSAYIQVIISKFLAYKSRCDLYTRKYGISADINKQFKWGSLCNCGRNKVCKCFLLFSSEIVIVLSSLQNTKDQGTHVHACIYTYVCAYVHNIYIHAYMKMISSFLYSCKMWPFVEEHCYLICNRCQKQT